MGGLCPGAAHPATEMKTVVVEVAVRCEALLAQRGYGPDEEVDVADDSSLAPLQQASFGGRGGFRCPTCGQPLKVRYIVQARATRGVVEGHTNATGPP